jgi:TatD DNase family protein
VAIGECGLDFFHTTPESIGAQKAAFIEQIHLANEIGKPLMLHIRNGKDSSMNAYRDVWEILKSECKVVGNAHFFAGSIEDAKLFLDIGFSVSFTGVVTFTRDYDEVVRYIPDDMIHAETDAPYVAPVPHRGSRNEPLYVIEVAKKLAEIRGSDTEQFEKQLIKNAHRMYNLQ